jgi:type II secretory pathway pseudopilin PulG
MKNRLRNGFTIPEIMVSSLIIGLSVAAISSSLGGIFKTGKGSDQTAYVTEEQDAISSLIQSMNQGQAAMALCPAPHPFYATKKDGTLGCDITYDPSKIPADKDSPKPQGWDASITVKSMTDASRELIDLVFQWHNEGQLRHDPNAQLSEAFYTKEIRPKLEAAQCFKCHGGSLESKEGRRVSRANREFMDAFSPMDLERLKARPSLYKIDFENFAEMTQPITTEENKGVTRLKPALATRTVLTSKVGQYLLRPMFSFDEVLQSSKGQGLRSTVKISADMIRVASSSYFPYQMTDYKKTTGVCSEGGLKCLNEAATPPDIFVAGSCKATCTHEKVNWCSCGKGCSKPCDDKPFLCDEYAWNYTCLSTAAMAPGTRSGLYPGSTGASQDSAFAKVADQQCLDAQNSNPKKDDMWCQKPQLICAADEPSDSVKVCMVPGSCQRRCARVLMDKGSSCGKDCFIPPKPVGCDSAEFQFQCKKIDTKPMNVMKYELDTRYIDLDSMGVKTIKASGVIQ